MSDDLAKLKEIEQMKDEQIAQLEKMKNVLKDKFTEAQKEIVSLKSQIEELKKENAAKKNIPSVPAKSEGQDSGFEIKPEVAVKINSSIAQLRMVVSELEKLPLESAQLSSMNIGESKNIRAGKPGKMIAQQQSQPEPEEEEEEAKPNQEFVRRKPSDVAKSQKGGQSAASEQAEQEFVRRKPSDVAKGSQPEVVKSSQPNVKQPTSANLSAAGSSSNAAAAPQPEAASQIKSLKYPADNIISCPQCKSRSYAQVDNKAKLISFVPREIYSKKYVCQQCKMEWEYFF
jgi:hypothetical protein